MKNLAFHYLLRWKMIILPILTTSLVHFPLQSWENVLFKLVSERVKRAQEPFHTWRRHSFSDRSAICESINAKKKKINQPCTSSTSPKQNRATHILVSVRHHRDQHVHQQHADKQHEKEEGELGHRWVPRFFENKVLQVNSEKWTVKSVKVMRMNEWMLILDIT